jgi:hypothetical protein
MDLDYHRVTIKLDGRCAAAAALWYWQPPMLGALFMPPAPDPAGVHPLGARGQSGSQGASPARMPVGWEMNFIEGPSCHWQEAFEKAPRGGITSIRAGAGLFKLAERGPPECRPRDNLSAILKSSSPSCQAQWHSKSGRRRY